MHVKNKYRVNELTHYRSHYYNGFSHNYVFFVKKLLENKCLVQKYRQTDTHKVIK